MGFGEKYSFIYSNMYLVEFFIYLLIVFIRLVLKNIIKYLYDF